MPRVEEGGVEALRERGSPSEDAVPNFLAAHPLITLDNCADVNLKAFASELLRQQEALSRLQRQGSKQSRWYPSMSFHQAVIGFAYDPATSFGMKFVFQSGSIFLVLVQILVAGAIHQAIDSHACVRDSDCPGARTCVPNWNFYGGRGKACFNCGDGPVRRALRPYLAANVSMCRSTPTGGTTPSAAEIAADDCLSGSCCQDGKDEMQKSCCAFAVQPVLRPDEADGFECPINDSVCHACYDSSLQAFRNYDKQQEIADNLSAMQPKDWVAVLLATLVLGLKIADEVQDVIVCDLQRARLSIREGQVHSTAYWITSILDDAKSSMRRLGLIPALSQSAYLFVCIRGGDAVSVCLNTVALVFLTEIDELVLRKFFSCSVLSEAEQLNNIELGETDLAMISMSRGVHAVTVPASIMFALIGAYFSSRDGKTLGIFAAAWIQYLPIIALAAIESQLQIRVTLAGGRLISAVRVILPALMTMFLLDSMHSRF